ncbi:GNAT family N-acetyltransferase [Dactylosporangium sp. CA-233914]|uniref:GNAT family N-acetyltransferase n=1 Tax=Dactylosporangium sp. CA-233914 TaxID=3239934 RepID=UPI003D926F91
MEVRALTGDQWRLKRDLRLAALRDSPHAFVSTHAREARRSEADWRSWPPGGAFFAAFDGPSAPVGIVGAWVAAAAPGTTHLIGMWVAPAVRGRGIAGLLAEAVVGWARSCGHDTVELELACGNTAALNAYLRCGFVPADRHPFTSGGTVLVRPVA